MPPACLQTGGSVTLDVTDANGVVHHIMIVLHPKGEPALTPSDPFFIKYIGRPEDRAAFLAAVMGGEEPTSPAVLHAKRTCISNNPFNQIDLSAAVACVTTLLKASVFNGVRPRAVAVTPVDQTMQLFNFGLVSSKTCHERIPDITRGSARASRNTLYSLYILHPQPSSIPPGPPPP